MLFHEFVCTAAVVPNQVMTPNFSHNVLHQTNVPPKLSKDQEYKISRYNLQFEPRLRHTSFKYELVQYTIYLFYMYLCIIL